MRSFRVPMLTLLSLMLLALPRARGQQAGFAGGAFVSLGFETPHNQGGFFIDEVARAGVYAEWLRPRVHPGLDVRQQVGRGGIQGTLVGPRASMTFGRFHPYAEVLFGPTYADFEPPAGTIIPPGGPVPGADLRGITTQGTIGIESDLSPYFRWRIIEFNQSSFSGIPGSHPQAFTTGIVFHIR
jgi:hypothetical protein